MVIGHSKMRARRNGFLILRPDVMWLLSCHFPSHLDILAAVMDCPGQKVPMRREIKGGEGENHNHAQNWDR